MIVKIQVKFGSEKLRLKKKKKKKSIICPQNLFGKESIIPKKKKKKKKPAAFIRMARATPFADCSLETKKRV